MSDMWKTSAESFAEDANFSLGDEIESGEINPPYDVVSMAMQQGAQRVVQPTTAAWKTSAPEDGDEPPPIGSKWKFQQKDITIWSWDGNPPKSVFYHYEGGTYGTSEMPIETWYIYVRNHRITPNKGTFYVEPHVGWRVWAIDKAQGLLQAPVQGTRYPQGSTWYPGQRCEANSEPNQGHRGGLYACDSRETLEAKQGTLDDYPVMGEVYMWGKFVKASHGYRAQFAYPKVFYIRDRALIPFLEKYNVPIVFEDNAIHRFADGWAILPLKAPWVELVDDKGQPQIKIAVQRGSDTASFEEIFGDRTGDPMAVQHIASWIDSLMREGKKVSWADSVADHHTTGNYDIDQDWTKQEVHPINNRQDLVTLEHALLMTDTHTKWNQSGTPIYSDSDQVDAYGIPLKHVTYKETPPDYIQLDLPQWTLMFQDMLAEIYKGEVDQMGFDLKKPQDIKNLVDTFWNTLIGTGHHEDTYSAMKPLDVVHDFPVIYGKLVQTAHSFDSMYTPPNTPQDEQLFDTDQYIMGVRVANPLARFALEYLGNLYDQGAKTITDSTGNYHHYWQMEKKPNTEVPMIRGLSARKLTDALQPRSLWFLFMKEEEPYLLEVDGINGDMIQFHYVDEDNPLYASIVQWKQLMNAGDLRPVQQAIPDAVPNHWARTAEYNGWANWDTWHVNLLLNNDQQTQEAWMELFERGITLAEFEQWAITNVLAPHNQTAIQDAQDWNAIPPETREQMRQEEKDLGRWHPDEWAADMTPQWLMEDHLIDWKSLYDSCYEDIGCEPPEEGGGIVPDTLPKNWSKTAEWTLKDVQDSQKWVVHQLNTYINAHRFTPEQAQDALLEEMREADMPVEWAWALLMEAWRVLERREPTGYDMPTRFYAPVPEPDAGHQLILGDRPMNDWRMSAEEEEEVD